MPQIAIYPGSFDPITNGHLDVIVRARRMFGRVIVAVAHDTEKAALFSVAERVAMVRKTIQHLSGVEVDHFKGLLVRYVRRKKARIVVRGLRAVSDFEFEFQLALMNRKLDPTFETIFLMPKDEYTFISSRLVREIAALGGDVMLFVPKGVEKALAAKFSRKTR